MSAIYRLQSTEDYINLIICTFITNNILYTIIVSLKNKLYYSTSKFIAFDVYTLE